MGDDSSTPQAKEAEVGIEYPTFSGLAREYQVRRIVCSLDSLIGLAGGAFVGVFWSTGDAGLGTTLVGVGATILSVLIAGFAVMASLTDRSFLLFLRQRGVLAAILFPFWLASMVWGFCIALGMISMIGHSWNSVAQRVVAALGGLFFGYGLTASIRLVGTTLRFVLMRAEFVAAVHDARGRTRDE